MKLYDLKALKKNFEFFYVGFMVARVYFLDFFKPPTHKAT